MEHENSLQIQHMNMNITENKSLQWICMALIKNTVSCFCKLLCNMFTCTRPHVYVMRGCVSVSHVTAVRLCWFAAYLLRL